MDEGVGAKLIEARERRDLGLDQVEAETKIRARYLRAMEREEWEALPGEAYARAFLRTYAGYLGLDAEAMAEQQRRGLGAARPGERLPQVDPRAPRRPRRERRLRISPGLLAAIVSAALVAVLVAIGIFGSGGSGGHPGASPSRGKEIHQSRSPAAGGDAARAPSHGHTLHLRADGEVWVCLLDSDGKRLVDGRILAPGSSEGPFRSGSFTFSLGNGEVTMTVDGRQAQIPRTSSPIGYSLVDGRLRRLSEADRPTCS